MILKAERPGNTGIVKKDDDRCSPLKLRHTFPFQTEKIRNNRLNLY